MSRLLLCLCCTISAFAQLPSGPTKGPVSAQQLVDVLASARQMTQSDAKISRWLARFQLSERLTDERLEKLYRDSGPKTRETLRILADASTFFDLPAEDRLSEPPPDLQGFRLIAARAAQYTMNYVRNLPDFLCTRITRRYGSENPQFRARLRRYSTSEGELSYNHGVEKYTHRAGRKEESGLTSFGEFGAIIGALFLQDSAAQIRWSHWERLNGTRVAVFRYSIDAAHSRYKVSDIGWYWLTSKTVGYDGLFFVEPASGEIHRITRQARDLADLSVGRADTFVDYSRVQVGAQSYVCPLRSVSYSAHYVNEIRFTNYRKFATESTLSLEEPAPAH